MKNYIKIFILFFLAVLILFFVDNFPLDKQKEKNTVQNIYKITSKQHDFIGYVVSQNSITLSFRTDGKIVFCPYTEGDFVKKRTLLAKNDGNINSYKLNEEVEKLEELKIKSARINKYYKRMNILHNSGAISDNDWEEAYYGAKTAKKEIEIQNEIVRQVKEKINYAMIYAPYDGYILKRILDKDEFAQTGEPVLILNNSNVSQVEAMVDYTARLKLKVNESAKITKNDKEYFGLVKQISSSSKDKGGYLVKIHLDKRYEELKEGENVQVEFRKLNNEKIYAPLKYVKKEKNQNFVYKLNKNKIEKTQINTGKICEFKGEFYIEILDNLKIGDEIIEYRK